MSKILNKVIVLIIIAIVEFLICSAAAIFIEMLHKSAVINTTISFMLYALLLVAMIFTYVYMFMQTTDL